MKFLTTDLIHKHLRLDGYPIEDDLLEVYADSAEEFIFEITFENCYPTYISDDSTRPTHPNVNGHAMMAKRAIVDILY